MILKILQAVVVSIFITLCCGIVAFLIGRKIDTENSIIIVSRSLICSIILQLGFVLSLMNNFIIALAMIQCMSNVISVFRLSTIKLKMLGVLYTVIPIAFVGIYLYGGKSNVQISFLGCLAIQTLICWRYDPQVIKDLTKQIGMDN